MYMKDWVAELDDFAQRYGKGILTDSEPQKRPAKS
jgi:hypothetical protein